MNSVHDSLICVSSSCDCSQPVQGSHMACERHRRRIKNVIFSSTLICFICGIKHVGHTTIKPSQSSPASFSFIQVYFSPLLGFSVAIFEIMSSKAIVFHSLHRREALTNVTFSPRIFQKSNRMSRILHYSKVWGR